MEKWQQQVEEILREHQGNEPPEWLKMTEELIKLTGEVEVPTGDAGQFVAEVLRKASEELRSLVLAYTAFRLGVAYERYQNANRTREP